MALTTGGPGLVAVGSDQDLEGDGSAVVWTSTDGRQWQRVPHDQEAFGGEGSQWIRAVTAGGPGLVAVGSGGQASGRAVVWTSP